MLEYAAVVDECKVFEEEPVVYHEVEKLDVMPASAKKSPDLYVMS